MTVAIINYGLGNLKSVFNALEYLGGEAFVAQSAGEMTKASHVVLPGVGAFGEGMQALERDGWFEAICEHAVEQERPFLGICLGMQLLAYAGEENGYNEGLGLVEGTVKRLQCSDPAIRIPHMGWNTVHMLEESRMYEGFTEPHDFYFVHSYALNTQDASIVSGVCHHGNEFVASVEKDNIWGVQYHPEKSQKPGLQLLQNFLKL